MLTTVVGNMRLSRLHIGHTRLTYRHMMTRNGQQSTCTNVACKNQRQSNIISWSAPQWRKSRKKNGIQYIIKTLLGKDCEVEKIMKFLKEIEIFEEI